MNPPGSRDYFISHTQRNPHAKILAEALYGSLEKAGKRVWLDVKMTQRSMKAMQEGVEGSKCVIAVITGAFRNDDEPDVDPAQNAYFARDMCIQELKWARAARVPIQPVVRVEDKKRILQFMQGAPEELKFLSRTDFIDLNRGDNEYWDLGVLKIQKAMAAGPRLSHGEIEIEDEAQKNQA